MSDQDRFVETGDVYSSNQVVDGKLVKKPVERTPESCETEDEDTEDDE